MLPTHFSPVFGTVFGGVKVHGPGKVIWNFAFTAPFVETSLLCVGNTWPKKVSSNCSPLRDRAGGSQANLRGWEGETSF